VPVKLGFIILSIIGVLRIPEEFYLYKDKKTKTLSISLVEETIDLSQVFENFYYIMLYRGLTLTTLVVIGSCKSNCRTVKTTTALIYN